MCLALTLSTYTFANCNDDFNGGITEYNFAAKYFERGVNAYNTAIELSQTANPDLTTICNHLVDAVTGFNVAADSYQGCLDFFTSATTSCSGDDSQSAIKNAEICQNNHSIAFDNGNVVRNILQNSCYATTGQVLIDEGLSGVKTI